MPAQETLIGSCERRQSEALDGETDLLRSTAHSQDHLSKEPERLVDSISVLLRKESHRSCWGTVPKKKHRAEGHRAHRTQQRWDNNSRMESGEPTGAEQGQRVESSTGTNPEPSKVAQRLPGS